MPYTDIGRVAVLGHDRASTVLRRSTQRVTYQPFGYAAAAHRADVLGYTGQRREPGSGYQLGNGRRLYRPSIMRFCQPDRLSPFGRGGLNAYTYCQGDPVNRHDPSGEAALDVLSDIVGALGIVAYGAMMFTGYRVSPPSKLMVGVDVTLMVSSIAALAVRIATDSDAAKIVSVAASALTVLGRGALAAQWGRQAFRARPLPNIQLTAVHSAQSLTRAPPRLSNTPPVRHRGY